MPQFAWDSRGIAGVWGTVCQGGRATGCTRQLHLPAGLYLCPCLLASTTASVVMLTGGRRGSVPDFPDFLMVTLSTDYFLPDSVSTAEGPDWCVTEPC